MVNNDYHRAINIIVDNDMVSVNKMLKKHMKQLIRELLEDRYREMPAESLLEILREMR